MPSAQYDFVFFKEGVPELEKYLLSPEIYWPLGIRSPKGERPYPRLTLGWLLLSRQRLQGHLRAGNLSAEQSPELETLRRELAGVSQRWQVAWEQKAAAEFSSRLKLWQRYMNNYRNDSAGFVGGYRYEVQRRAMLTLLSEETAGIPDSDRELLRGMDAYLRGVLRGDDFVWDHNLAVAFSARRFWYLYGELPAS